MDDLFKTLSAVLRLVGNDPQVIEAAAIAAWKKAAGDGLRQHAIPLRLTDGTLVVAGADAVWQKQLGAMKDQLIYRTNSIIGQPLVRQIELTVDPQLTKAHSPPTDDKRPLDNQVPLELWSAASAISDKELRQKFLRAATSAIQRRQDDEAE